MDSERLRLLARWGLFLAIVVIGLFATFFGGLASVASRPGFGGDHDELLIAAYAPAMYRVSMAFDALGWLAMGGLIVLGGLAFAEGAPIRGRLASLLGVTAVAGIIGAFVRMFVLGDLGEAFAAPAADQQAVLTGYRLVDGLITACFAAGQLTIGLGFVVVGSAALATSWVPRSIGWMLSSLAVTTYAILAGQVVLDVFLRPILLAHVALMAVVGVVLARRWWSAGEGVRVPASA